MYLSHISGIQIGKVEVLMMEEKREKKLAVRVLADDPADEKENRVRINVRFPDGESNDSTDKEYPDLDSQDILGLNDVKPPPKVHILLRIRFKYLKVY